MINRKLYYMEMADLTIAQKSKDQSSKVGCVIVNNDDVVGACNTIPNGCKDEEYKHERPEKYYWFVHAETHTIAKAARLGISTDGGHMFLNWYPCSGCAGLIVQAGIKKLYVDCEPNWNDNIRGKDRQRSKEILESGGVEVIYMNYKAHRQGLDN